MHEAVAPLQVGLSVVGTVGISGALFAAGNLLGRRRRRDPEAQTGRPSEGTDGREELEGCCALPS
jgi:hypothetical protein